MRKYDSYKDSGVKWIGKIPSHWNIMRSKNMFERVFRAVREEDDVITCFRDGQVTLRKNRRTEGFTESFKEIGYQGIRKGDLVIHQMDAFAGSIGVSDSDGKGTPVYICCVPKGPYNNYYYAYLLREMARTGYIKSLYRGIRERSSDFRFETFAVQSLPIPPLSEQKVIVSFLDSKTLEIDNLISKVEREIELLKEYKQAEIARVVTHGLNPNAPTKPSGISWISDIPKHWSIRKLSQVATEYFVSNKSIHHQNLLSLSYGAIVRKDINTTEGLLPASFDTYQVVKKDIIVMRLTDLQNDHRSLRVGIAKEEGIVTSAYTSIKVRETILPNYLYYQLHTNDIHKVFYGMGDGLRQSLNFAGMKNLRLLLPPIEEQEEIVDYINRKTTEIDRLVVELTYQVEYLKEYKQRLIADVVTGKINVQPY